MTQTCVIVVTQVTRGDLGIGCLPHLSFGRSAAVFRVLVTQVTQRLSTWDKGGGVCCGTRLRT